MASKVFYECGCMEQGDEEFPCAQHRQQAGEPSAPQKPEQGAEMRTLEQATKRIEQLEAILAAIPDCPTCKGEGWLMDVDGAMCPDCDGSPHILGGTGKYMPPSSTPEPRARLAQTDQALTEARTKLAEAEQLASHAAQECITATELLARERTRREQAEQGLDRCRALIEALETEAKGTPEDYEHAAYMHCVDALRLAVTLTCRCTEPGQIVARNICTICRGVVRS